MFNQKKGIEQTASFICPDCKSDRFRVSGSKIECTNCSYEVKTNRPKNKYGAKRTEFNGRMYDSGFEADVAQSLEIRKKGGEIKDYDNQYTIEAWAHRADGTKAFKVKHKVDFRIHHNDGSYELYEAKGVFTSDYQWRRKFLENIWLPEHPDHIYTVITQQNKWRNKWNSY